MLNFDEDRYRRIQTGAVGLQPGLHQLMGSLTDRGLTNLFFVGSGGAGILMQPAAGLLRARSALPVFDPTPAELVATGSGQLGPDSVVVIPSLSGTTSESVSALAYCRERGATVVSLTGHADTPLARDAHHSFVNFAADDTSCESFYLQSLVIALSLMRHRGELEQHDEIVAELAGLPDLLVELKRAFEPRAAELAERIAARDYHVITGAGSSWPEAWYYGMCILEEMQWIRTRPVHAADFFHGTLELVEPGVSVLLLKGEDPARPLVERVEHFLPQVIDDGLVLDAAQLPLPGVSARTRALVSPVLLAAALERVSAHLEVLRDHPLSTRRYYRRLAY